jgi:glycine cleavage system H protein
MTKTYYSPSHEYISVEDGVATVGITTYAQSQLGDIVFVELPETGRGFKRGDEAAVVESVKAASEVYTPVTGETTEMNEELAANPGLANDDPEGAGWFFKQTVIQEDELAKLMDRAQYDAFVKENQ